MILFIGLLNSYSIPFPSLCISPLHNYSTVTGALEEGKPLTFSLNVVACKSCFVEKMAYSTVLGVNISQIDCQIITPNENVNK